MNGQWLLQEEGVGSEVRGSGGTGTRNPGFSGTCSTMEKGFSSFFAIFDDFSKWGINEGAAEHLINNHVRQNLAK